MSRVSDLQIQAMNERDDHEFVTDMDWDIHALMEMESRLAEQEGMEEIVGTIARARVLLEIKRGF